MPSSSAFIVTTGSPRSIAATVTRAPNSTAPVTSTSTSMFSAASSANASPSTAGTPFATIASTCAVVDTSTGSRPASV